MSWEPGGDPDEYARQGQTGQMPAWGGQETAGYPQQDQIPPGYGQGDVPPPGYLPPGYVMPGHVPAPGWMPGYIVMPGPPPRSHLARSIVGLFFLWPLAIAAIVQSSQVESRYARGDYDGAVRASRNARICANISIWGGIALVALMLFLLALIARDAAPYPPDGLGFGTVAVV